MLLIWQQTTKPSTIRCHDALLNSLMFLTAKFPTLGLIPKNVQIQLRIANQPKKSSHKNHQKPTASTFFILTPTKKKKNLVHSPLKTWVCLKIGYIPNYSHLLGIMISKTIGFKGWAYFQTHPYPSPAKSCMMPAQVVHPTSHKAQPQRPFHPLQRSGTIAKVQDISKGAAWDIT